MGLGRLAGGGGEASAGADRSRSFQYGAETEKVKQQLALEKEIQMRLQDEVKPPPPSSCPGESLAQSRELKALAQLADCPGRASSLSRLWVCPFAQPWCLAWGLAGGSSVGV